MPRYYSAASLSHREILHPAGNRKCAGTPRTSPFLNFHTNFDWTGFCDIEVDCDPVTAL